MFHYGLRRLGWLLSFVARLLANGNFKCTHLKRQTKLKESVGFCVMYKIGRCFNKSSFTDFLPTLLAVQIDVYIKLLYISILNTLSLVTCTTVVLLVTLPVNLIKYFRIIYIYIYILLIYTYSILFIYIYHLFICIFLIYLL